MFFKFDLLYNLKEHVETYSALLRPLNPISLSEQG